MNKLLLTAKIVKAKYDKKTSRKVLYREKKTFFFLSIATSFGLFSPPLAIHTNTHTLPLLFIHLVSNFSPFLCLISFRSHQPFTWYRIYIHVECFVVPANTTGDLTTSEQIHDQKNTTWNGDGVRVSENRSRCLLKAAFSTPFFLLKTECRSFCSQFSFIFWPKQMFNTLPIKWFCNRDCSQSFQWFSQRQ